MSDPLKDKRVKDCPNCKVVIMMGEAVTFFCSKHSRFGKIAQRPTPRAADEQGGDDRRAVSYCSQCDYLSNAIRGMEYRCPQCGSSAWMTIYINIEQSPRPGG